MNVRLKWPSTSVQCNIWGQVQEWKEHLERQLDSVLGRRVRGTLRVLPGLHNRLQGGLYPL